MKPSSVMLGLWPSFVMLDPSAVVLGLLTGDDELSIAMLKPSSVMLGLRPSFVMTDPSAVVLDLLTDDDEFFIVMLKPFSVMLKPSSVMPEALLRDAGSPPP
jgi:hypothetical protein